MQFEECYINDNLCPSLTPVKSSLKLLHSKLYLPTFSPLSFEIFQQTRTPMTSHGDLSIDKSRHQLKTNGSGQLAFSWNPWTPNAGFQDFPRRPRPNNDATPLLLMQLLARK